jgi:gliding motility-associated lipoprotein GldD
MKYCALLLPVLGILLFGSCEETSTTPKPRAYPRVVYPKKEYVPFDASYCRFTFDQAVYAKLEQDTNFFGERPKDACWFNLDVPQLNAKIYCSYSPIGSRKDFDELVKDAFSMTNKHNLKANYIDEIPVHRQKDRVHGVLFSLEGSAASSCQFFLTDSTQHFLRGALYFNTQTKPDSLAPVIDFMRADLNRLVQTLTWK